MEPDWKYTADRVTDDVDRIVKLDREVRKELMKYSSEELIKKSLSRGLLPEALKRLVWQASDSEVLHAQGGSEREALVH